MHSPKVLVTAAALWLSMTPQLALADNQLAYQLVEELTVEIGPRLAGSPEDAKSVAWATNKFKQLGYDKVWTEEFKPLIGSVVKRACK